jgi:hypothetical protein
VKTSLFGLDVTLPWPVQGCPPRRWAGTRPPLEVVAATPADLDAEWDAAAAEPVVREPGRGRALLTVNAGGGGYRVAWRHIGRFLVTADSRVLCAPDRGGEAHFERYLLAQILPLAAVMAGIEVLHAGAVVIDGRAVGLAGAAGAGKSTTARALIEDGATLLTDDVLAVTRDDGRLMAHPGPDQVRIGPAEAKQPVQLQRTDEPVRLDTLFFLDRGAPRQAVGAPVGFRTLAGATFNLLVRTPERLERHLDIASTLAADDAAVTAAFPPDVAPAQVARDLVAWLGQRGWATTG